MKRIGVGIALLALAILVAIVWQRRQSAHGTGDGTGTAQKNAARGRLADPFTRAKSRISGHVRDESGKPIASAQVCARGWSEELTSNETRAPTCTAARADGAYELTDLLPARYSVGAAAPHFKPNHYRAGDRDWFEVTDGDQKSGVDIVLDRGGVQVRGRVKDISGSPTARR